MKPIQLHAPSRTFHHGNLSGYVIGLAVSGLLTLASFGSVMTGLLPRGAVMGVLVALCVAQLLAQLVFFLQSARILPEGCPGLADSDGVAA